MSLFDFFRTDKNPTKTWKKAGSELVFDLNASTLNGIALGDPCERLSFLGPRENMTKSLRPLEYFSMGIVVDLDEQNGNIDCFILYWNDFIFNRCSEFKGKCLFNGVEIPLSASTTQEEFVAFFGKPVCIDVDWGDDQPNTCLFYQLGKIRWEVEFTPEHRLNEFILSETEDVEFLSKVYCEYLKNTREDFENLEFADCSECGFQVLDTDLSCPYCKNSFD